MAALAQKSSAVVTGLGNRHLAALSPALCAPSTSRRCWIDKATLQNVSQVQRHSVAANAVSRSGVGE